MEKNQTLPFVFDLEKLERIALEQHETYVRATPFPHIVLDDFLTGEELEKVLGEFPKPGSADWLRLHHENSKKLALNDELQFGENTRRILTELNSSTFLGFLEKLTGIEGLVPDPHFWGGGLHQIERGGFLNVHADFNWYEKLKLDRRLNLLLYLNQDWSEGYGGHLELWSRDMSRSEKKILPVFNRCVIFSTTDFSYHGHPTPLTCPEGRTRKSLALYYYTNGRPLGEVSRPHSTLYQKPGARANRSLWDLLKWWIHK